MSSFETEQLAHRLVQKLRGGDPGGRVQAAIRLSEMSESARPVLNDLLNALQDHDPGVRKVAAWVLGYVGLACPEVVRALDRATTDPDAAVRKAARAARMVSNLPRAA